MLRLFLINACYLLVGISWHYLMVRHPISTSTQGAGRKGSSLVAMSILMEALGQLMNVILHLTGPRIMKPVLLLVKENYRLIWIVITSGLIDDLGAEEEVRILLVSHGSCEVCRRNSWVVSGASFTVAMSWCQRLALIVLVIWEIVINAHRGAIFLLLTASPWGNWSLTLWLTLEFSIEFNLILLKALSDYFIVIIIKHAHMADVASVLVFIYLFGVVLSTCNFWHISFGSGSGGSDVMIKFLQARIINLPWQIEAAHPLGWVLSVGACAILVVTNFLEDVSPHFVLAVFDQSVKSLLYLFLRNHLLRHVVVWWFTIIFLLWVGRG